MKSIFNWFAGYSSHKCTLGEVANRLDELLFIKPTGNSIRDDAMKVSREIFVYEDFLNRGGRITERAITLSAAFFAVSLGVATGGFAGVAAAVGVLTVGKVAGLAAGWGAANAIHKAACKRDGIKG